MLSKVLHTTKVSPSFVVCFLTSHLTFFSLDLFPEIARRENPLVEPNYSDQQNEKNSLKHRNKQQTMDPNEKQKSDETLISSSSTSKTHKPLGHQIGYALLTIIVLVCILVAVKIAQKI